MAISIASRKAKAREFQKLVAGWVAQLTGLPCGKDCPIESRPMGEPGCDIRLDNEARKLFPYSIECKKGHSWSVPEAVRQARQNSYPGTDWLVVLGYDRDHANDEKTPIAVIDAKVLFKILNELHSYRTGKIHKPRSRG